MSVLINCGPGSRKAAHPGADLDRFIKFAQTCQSFPKNFSWSVYCKVQMIPDFMGSEFTL